MGMNLCRFEALHYVAAVVTAALVLIGHVAHRVCFPRKSRVGGAEEL